jgi:tetratricopeptide (TPR) repeat protein
MSKSGARLVAVAASLAIIVAAVAATAWHWRRPRIADIVAAYDSAARYDRLTIEYPLDETLFPPDIAAPTFRWIDSNGRADTYLVTLEFPGGNGRMNFFARQPQWTPPAAAWEAIKKQSLEKEARVTILGVNHKAPRTILSASQVRIKTSRDEVGAPIFYREVILPFIDAVKDPSRIRWRFGAVSSPQQPPIVLEGLPVCGNCHSFSADARILGMDVDYANDKGSYAITQVKEDMTLSTREIITWSEYRKEDKELTFGLLSQVSPDGRYVVSTVKDMSVFVAKPGVAFSQLFFPIKGILCIYDRQTGTFKALEGANDPNLVQSNPAWSPDGKYIVFARTTAYTLKNARGEKKVLLSPEECTEFLTEGKPFLYDLCRIPFNEGRGGRAEPIPGASGNGMSNFFGRYSPDGKWIVFCMAKSYMLLQPDSELYVIPAEGGQPRKLRANTHRMNSWHSWSPNGKWLVFSSKANTVYTQLFLTHIDEQGDSSPAVLLDHFTAPDRAANIPEFVNAQPSAIRRIHEQFLDDYSYFRAGISSLRVDDSQGAEQGYRKALELNPGNVQAHVDLAYILLNRGAIDEGMMHVNEALRLDPNNVEARFNLGLGMVRQKRTNEAIEHFSRVVQVKPDYAEAHYQLGVLLMQKKQVDEAVSHLSIAARLRPDHADTHFNLGVLLAGQKKVDEAISHLSAAAQLRPDDAETHFNLGVLLAEQGKLDEAVAQYLKAAQLLPNDARIPYNLGATVARQGKLDEAVKYLTKAVQLRPDYAEAYVNLGVMLARQKKMNEAIGYLTKAVELQPNDTIAHYNLAMALASSGRHVEAIDHWMRVTQLDPGNIGAILNLAASYDKAGQRTKAVSCLQQALDAARAAGNVQAARQIAEQLKSISN